VAAHVPVAPLRVDNRLADPDVLGRQADDAKALARRVEDRDGIDVDAVDPDAPGGVDRYGIGIPAAALWQVVSLLDASGTRVQPGQFAVAVVSDP
jgi:hypothetical protein